MSGTCRQMQENLGLDLYALLNVKRQGCQQAFLFQKERPEGMACG